MAFHTHSLRFLHTAGFRREEGELVDKQVSHPGHMHMNGSTIAGGTGSAIKDPVCGMTVNPAAARHIEYAGKTYYFCSASCETKFQSAPDQYIGAISAPAGHERPDSQAHGTTQSAGPNKAAAKGNTKYTCPMHPEIVRDAPGDCPICGMALVPIAGTGEDEVPSCAVSNGACGLALRSQSHWLCLRCRR